MYILDKQSSSPNIKLPYANRPDTAQRQISKRTTDAIRGAVGFRDGVHTFEIDFNDKPWGSHCAIGVCSSSVQLYDQGKLNYINLHYTFLHSYIHICSTAFCQNNFENIELFIVKFMLMII